LPMLQIQFRHLLRGLIQSVGRRCGAHRRPSGQGAAAGGVSELSHRSRDRRRVKDRSYWPTRKAFLRASSTLPG
jgi:hypothetical protein